MLLAAAHTPGELLDTLRSRRPADTGACRVAVLDPTPERVRQAAGLVARGEPWRGGNDLWFTPGPGLGGVVVFLFPGLDARTGPGHDDIRSWFGLPAEQGAASDSLGARTQQALRLNRVLDTALRRVSITPAAVAGHSAGEWSALFAAGTFAATAFEGLAREMGTSPVPDVVFAAVGLPARDAAQLAEAEPGVVLSHDNAPDQSVICGEEDAVARCLDRIADPAVPRRVLPFRSGFHTPMLTPFLPGFATIFDRIPLERPRVPVWSATTVRPYPEDEASLRALLERHLLEPVLFRSLVDRLYDDGARVFVQVGCGSLPRFVSATLADRPHAVVSAGSTTRPQLDQLRWAAAALWAEGREPDLAALGLAPLGSDTVATAYAAATATVSASIDVVYRSWKGRA